MAEKKTFVMRMSYAPILADMTNEQAGALIKSIYAYVSAGNGFDEITDPALKMAAKFIKQDLDLDLKNYIDKCNKNAANGRKGGKNKANANEQAQESKEKANASERKRTQANASEKSERKHSDYDYDSDNDSDYDYKQQLLTAPKRADKPQQKPKQLNQLQLFAEEVIKNFEPDVKTPDQKSIWYKRNCRCLTDILKFCERNIPLAIKTIDVCLERMEKAGYACGYEAVCRNLPEYMSVAKQKMGVAYAQAR